MLGRSVALKVIRRDRLGAAGSKRFVEEAQLLAALNHPHIVQLYDAGIHGGGPYLALEYVDGETSHPACGSTVHWSLTDGDCVWWHRLPQHHATRLDLQ
jgi:serine/threonine protein kinase